MSKRLFFILMIFFLVSCDSKPKRTPPTVFLTEPQMIDVITDVQIMEATISYKKNVNQKTAYLKTIGYDTLFAHHGITDSIFTENMTYYYEVEPQVFIRILDSVEMRLTKMKN